MGFSLGFLRPGGAVKQYGSVPVVLQNCIFCPKTPWPKTLVENLAQNLAKNQGTPTMY